MKSINFMTLASVFALGACAMSPIHRSNPEVKKVAPGSSAASVKTSGDRKIASADYPAVLPAQDIEINMSGPAGLQIQAEYVYTSTNRARPDLTEDGFRMTPLQKDDLDDKILFKAGQISKIKKNSRLRTVLAADYNLDVLRLHIKAEGFSDAAIDFQIATDALCRQGDLVTPEKLPELLVVEKNVAQGYLSLNSTKATNGKTVRDVCVSVSGKPAPMNLKFEFAK